MAHASLGPLVKLPAPAVASRESVVVEPGIELGVEPRMEAGSSTEVRPVMVWYQPELVETRVEARMMMAVAESPVEVPLMGPAVVAAVPAPGRRRVWLPEERKSETEGQDETQPFHRRVLLRRIDLYYNRNTAIRACMPDAVRMIAIRHLRAVSAPCLTAKYALRLDLDEQSEADRPQPEHDQEQAGPHGKPSRQIR